MDRRLVIEGQSIDEDGNIHAHGYVDDGEGVDQGFVNIESHLGDSHHDFVGAGSSVTITIYDEHGAGPEPDKPDHWPDHIEAKITPAGNWGWYDTLATPTKENPDGRTYPSWIEDGMVREIELHEEDLSGEHPTREQKDLVFEIRMRVDGRVPAREMLEAVMGIEGCIKKLAREKLVGLWKAGLVRRYGKYDGRSNRLCKQEWEVA